MIIYRFQHCNGKGPYSMDNDKILWPAYAIDLDFHKAPFEDKILKERKEPIDPYKFGLATLKECVAWVQNWEPEGIEILIHNKIELYEIDIDFENVIIGEVQVIFKKYRELRCTRIMSINEIYNTEMAEK